MTNDQERFQRNCSSGMKANHCDAADARHNDAVYSRSHLLLAIYFCTLQRKSSSFDRIRQTFETWVPRSSLSRTSPLHKQTQPATGNAAHRNQTEWNF